MAAADIARRIDSLRRSGLLAPRTFISFDKLTELAAGLIGAPVSLMSMVDEDRQYFTSQFGLPHKVAAARQTPLTESVCASVVETNEVVAVDDMANDPRFDTHPARSSLRVEAYCGVPIRDPDGEVLGSFCVLDDHERTWTDDDIALLETFSHIVGDYIRTTQEHHTLVSGLQDQLIPPRPPETPAGVIRGRYRPVERDLSVGGDFFDWNVRDDGTIDLVLGDVVGHGLEPTQAAAQLRAASRAVFFGSTLTPDATIRRLADSCAELPGCASAALTIVRISADGSVVRWARAGSLPPVVVGPGGAHVADSEVCPPLGLGRCDERHVAEVSLEPTGSIVFFSDGLIERRGESIDDGLARAAAAAARSIDVDDLIAELCPPSVRDDDVAVLTFTRRSE